LIDRAARQFAAAFRLVGLLGVAAASMAVAAEDLQVPWSRQTFLAEEGCRWQPGAAAGAPRGNAHYLAPPGPGDDWHQWLGRLRAYRTQTRAHLHDAAQAQIRLDFDGRRAWIRTDRTWAFAADLRPGETMVLKGQARWLEGANRLCLAIDWCDRSAGADGPWRDWSTVLASEPIAPDGAWHEFRLAARVPAFPEAQRWARPIFGMDGTFDKARASMLLRQLQVELPAGESRAERLRPLGRQLARPVAFDDAIYRRDDLRWMTGNFVCGFLMVYDRAFWDPEKAEYRVGPLCDEAGRQFAGFDSVVLWHAYPRIGADPRNQFDFFRDMPGGLAGLREAVREFHRRGIKVFLPYNPWDTGTARDPVPDDAALARAVAGLEADGIFLDTMIVAPGGLRRAVDALRPGVAFEPEGHPSIEEIERCSGSWAQWLAAYPEIGVLHLKWLEPRHMQHQIRRWDTSHQDELAAAWLNGSGMLVWENIFGYWNPWNAVDRAVLRRMTPVLRRFAPLLAEGDWLPYFPTRAEKVHASCWSGSGLRLWTLVNLSGRKTEGPILEVDDQGEEFFDLWHGRAIEPQRVGGKVRLTVPLERYGAIAARAIAALAGKQPGAADGIEKLLACQRQESLRTVPAVKDDPYVAARPVLEPKPAPARASLDARSAAGMLKIDAGPGTFAVRHMRRECGCYPDPGTPPERWPQYLTGNPHTDTVEHRVTVTLTGAWIDPQPVTNAQFDRFVKAAGYRPRCRDKFLHHWGGPACPAALADKPVVYVDLDDARAYAAWARRRLPTEWEWQRAAQLHGERFTRAEVFEWTESERDDGHTRFVMLRGGSRYKAEGSIWYFPGGPQPVQSHAKFLLMHPGLDRAATIGFRCLAPAAQ